MASNEIQVHFVIDGQELLKQVVKSLETIGKELREQAKVLEPLKTTSYLKAGWVPPGVRDNSPYLEEIKENEDMQRQEIHVYAVKPNARWYLGIFHRDSNRLALDVYFAGRIGPQKLVDIMRGLLLRNKNNAFPTENVFFYVEHELVGLGWPVPIADSSLTQEDIKPLEDSMIDHSPAYIAPPAEFIGGLIRPELPFHPGKLIPVAPGELMYVPTESGMAQPEVPGKYKTLAQIMQEVGYEPKWQKPPTPGPHEIAYTLTTPDGVEVHTMEVPDTQRYVRLPHVFTHTAEGTTPEPATEVTIADWRVAMECERYNISAIERAAFLAYYKLPAMGNEVTADMWEDWCIHKKEAEKELEGL